MVAAVSNVDPIEDQLQGYAKQFAAMILAEVRSLIAGEQTKEWYTTDELAKALGKSGFTVREKWCNAGRIDAEKDQASGKWHIPGHEYRRLVSGGSLRPKPR